LLLIKTNYVPCKFFEAKNLQGTKLNNFKVAKKFLLMSFAQNEKFFQR